MKRLITFKIPQNNFPKEQKFETNTDSPYELVDLLRKNLNKSTETKVDKFATTPIADIMPIHNLSGIRDLNQITQMRAKIRETGDIFDKVFFPNIKLIVAPEGKLLLFDGTHSLLAYFIEGRKMLNEVSYLIISTENFGPVTSNEIAYFFPEDHRSQVKDNWEKYVVNWQAEGERQLETREVNSIAHLASQLGKRDESAVEE